MILVCDKIQSVLKDTSLHILQGMDAHITVQHDIILYLLTLIV